MQRSALLDHCVALYESYDGSKTTIDSHAEDYIKAQHITEPADSLFVKQVFYGCLRYKKMLKILLDYFYSQHSGTTLFRDSTVYMIFAYLAIVRMDELTFREFRKFVLSLPAIKMHVFVSFLFDRESLLNIKDEWCKHYEESFVQESFVNQLLKWTSEAQELVNKLKQNVSGLQRSDSKSAAKQPTVPEPFNITKPKTPKPVVVEAPPSTPPRMRRSFDKDKIAQEQENSEKQLLARKDENRKKLQDKYTDSRYAPFQFLSQVRPSKKEKIAKELEEQTLQIMQTVPKALPAPTPLPPVVPVKLNTAAILREEAFFKKKQEEEAKALEMYEATLHDQTDYNLWQEQMREMEMIKRQEDIEKRRIEQQIQQEELQKAKEEALRQKRESAAALAAQKKALSEQNMQRTKEEQAHMKVQAEEIKVSRQHAIEAKQKLKTQNRKIVQEVNKEKEMLKKQAEEERESERKRKEDLIKQIRALEKVSNREITAATAFDPAECASQGFFSEMSLAELKERLVLLKQREQELLEEKRKEIIEKKQAKADELMARAQKIAQLRAKAEKDSAAKREARKSMEEQRKKREQERYEQTVLLTHEKLKEKKEVKQAEAERIAQERRQAGQRAEFLFENREMLEEKKFEEKEKGEEREAKMNQLKQQQAAQSVEKRKQEQEQLRKKAILQKQKQEEEKIKVRKKEKEIVRLQEQQRAASRQTPTAASLAKSRGPSSPSSRAEKRTNGEETAKS